MTKQQRLKLSFKEAITDTFIGTLLNAPINFAIITAAFAMELSALTTSLVCTVIFTAIAIVRKVLVRLHFHRKEQLA